MEKYNNRTDARLRLNQTVCLFKGLPYYIQVDERFVEVINDREVQSETKVYGYRLPNKSSTLEVIDYTDDEFTTNNIELGYLQGETNAQYFYRIPDRSQKQGLNTNGVATNGKHSFSQFGGFSAKKIVPMFTGNHPSLEEATKMLKEDPGLKSVCFHRCFALGRENSQRLLSLMYKGKVIASQMKINGPYIFTDTGNLSFMAREIERYGVNIHV